MRVLIAAGFIGRYGETDGVVTTYRNLIPLFEQSDIEADILAYGHEDAIEQRGKTRLIIHSPRIPLKIDPIRWIDPMLFNTRLLSKTLKERYDIVQVSTPDPMGVAAISIARKSGAALIQIYHTALDHYAQIRFTKMFGRAVGEMLGNFMHKWLARSFRTADLVLAPSEAACDDARKLTSAPIEVLGRGVESDRFHPDRRTRDDQKVRVLYVGRVAPEKSLDLLVRIFRDRDDVELMVVGDGPYLEELRKENPNAIAPGRLLGDDLLNAYADADIFAFPSKTDTLGNVILEGMSSGLPAVVTDVMGPKELVLHGETGFVASTEEEFLGYLDSLIGDLALRQRMSIAAREFAVTRSWESIFNTLVGYYDMVLEMTDLRRADLKRKKLVS